MEVREKDDFMVVGLEVITTVQECATNNPHPKLWKDFTSRVGEIKNKVGNVFYGYSKEISKKECSFRSIAGVEVSDLDNIPEGMVGLGVPASKYLVFEHKGKVENLTDTYNKLYEDDIPKSGFKLKEIWLEVYDERFKENSDDSIMEIWASIE